MTEESFPVKTNVLRMNSTFLYYPKTTMCFSLLMRGVSFVTVFFIGITQFFVQCRILMVKSRTVQWARLLYTQSLVSVKNSFLIRLKIISYWGERHIKPNFIITSLITKPTNFCRKLNVKPILVYTVVHIEFMVFYQL